MSYFLEIIWTLMFLKTHIVIFSFRYDLSQGHTALGHSRMPQTV